MEEKNNDKEVLLKIFRDSKIPIEIENGNIIIYGGYFGFYTIFTFNNTGKLLAVGAYE